MRIATVGPGCIAMMLSSAAVAQAAVPGAPAFQSLIACSRIAADAARLACFDQASKALSEAAASRQLVVLSPEDVRNARHSLFGFSLPKLPFLRQGGDDREDKEITAKIRSVRSLGYGKWRFQLDDGATWETTESNGDEVVPHVGSTVRINAGVLSSFFVHFDGARGVKATRIG